MLLNFYFSEVDDCTIKTMKGEWCHFPFTYKGVKYEKCTTEDYFKPWCATNDKFKWDVCGGNHLPIYYYLQGYS